jgi:hypothetical protein
VQEPGSGEHHRALKAAKAAAHAEDHIDRPLAGLQRNVVEIALVVRLRQIRRRRDEAMFDRQYGSDDLYRPSAISLPSGRNPVMWKALDREAKPAISA